MLTDCKLHNHSSKNNKSNAMIHCSQSGFTLVELSVVILIIGLLASGLYAGAAVVQNAKFRSIGKEVDNYRTAVFSFKTKYNALPGDIWDLQIIRPLLENALDYQSSVRPDDSTRGNNNGAIEYCSADSCQSHALGGREGAQAWLMLAGAEMIPPFNKHFQLIMDSPSVQFTRIALEINAPRASQVGGGYFMDYVSFFTGLPPENIIGIGAEDNNYRNDSSVLTVSEAFDIDTKYDDGDPKKGEVWAGNGFDLYGTDPFPGSNTNEESGLVGRNGDSDEVCINSNRKYNKDSQEKVCIMAFKIGT